MKTSSIEIRPYTSKELAELYCVSTNTFQKWIDRHRKAIGEKIGHFYTIKQVQVIFEKLGYPFMQGFEEDKEDIGSLK